MKLTKLQKDALSLARWMVDEESDPWGEPDNVASFSDELDSIWDEAMEVADKEGEGNKSITPIAASVILSEVM